MEDVIYQDIAAALTDATATAYLAGLGLPPVSTVALFNNQYRKEEVEEAYGLPAVFVEFSTAIYSRGGRCIDEVEDRIRIHIEQKNFVTYRHNHDNLAAAMDVLRFINAIHVILAGISSTAFGPLYRVARELDTDHGNAPVHIYEYATQYADLSTDRYRDSVQGSEDVAPVIQKQLVRFLKKPEAEAGNPYKV